MRNLNVSELELQTHQDIELGRHKFNETQLREIETHISSELNRPYQIPDRKRLKLRDY